MRSSYLHCLLLACAVGIFFTGCDQSSQNVDYQRGEGISVSGPAELIVPNFDSSGTASYTVKAYTIDKEYAWSVEGATLADTVRGGEVAVVSTADSSASYTVTVETTVDGQNVSGSASGSARYPDAASQLGKYSLNQFTNLAGATGLVGILGNRDTTALVPTDEAFFDALDANQDTSISDEELPAIGVVKQILQYHVIPGETLRSANISNGQMVPTVFGGELTFNTGGNGITVDGAVNSAGYTGPDIASDGLTFHQIDTILLPSAAVSINEQTVTRTNNTDTVHVAGTYVSNGGFVVLHEQSSGDVIGHSDYLPPGFHGNTGTIPVQLDSQLQDDTTMVVAMPHRDSDDNQMYNFPTTDGPYKRGSENVTDVAPVTLP